MIKNALIPFSLAVLLAGCTSTSERAVTSIPVESRPAGSDVVVTCAKGEPVASKSPALLPAGSDAEKCTVVVSKPGYEPATALVTRVAMVGKSNQDPISVVLTLEPEREKAR